MCCLRHAVFCVMIRGRQHEGDTMSQKSPDPSQLTVPPCLQTHLRQSCSGVQPCSLEGGWVSWSWTTLQVIVTENKKRLILQPKRWKWQVTSNLVTNSMNLNTLADLTFLSCNDFPILIPGLISPNVKNKFPWHYLAWVHPGLSTAQDNCDWGEF